MSKLNIASGNKESLSEKTLENARKKIARIIKDKNIILNIKPHYILIKKENYK